MSGSNEVDGRLNDMVVELERLRKKILLVVAGIGASAVFGRAISMQVQAEWHARTGSEAGVERALALQPRNAELHNRKGRMLLFSPESEAAAGASLERAVAINPRRASYWLDVALERELRGDAEGAELALESARKAEPRTPQVLWHAANYFLRRGETERALAASRELLRAAPEYTSRVLPLLERAAPADELIARVVPDDAEALCALLERIARTEDHAGAERAWERAMRLGAALRPACFRYFLDALIADGKVRTAERVWRDAIARGWIEADRSALQGPFYNGDFRFPLLNHGFDWRVQWHPEASVWIEASGPEPGQQALCVQFDESARAEFAHVTRYVPAEPETHYAVRAMVKSDRLVTKEGAYLVVEEAGPHTGGAAGMRAARSEEWFGTNRWKEVAFHFTTGPETQLLKLTLKRPAAQGEEPAASGAMCLAAVEWKRLGRSAGERGQGAER